MATVKATLSGPEVDVNSSVVAKFEAPLVQIGLTSNDVNISALGKKTTINGNCIVVGDLEVKGTTTSINTT